MSEAAMASTATLLNHAKGTHISQGKGKTPKGEITVAYKDRGLASAATLEGHPTGTHISKGTGKTKKGDLTLACKDRPGELGRLKTSHANLDSRKSFDRKLAQYRNWPRIPRDTLRRYGKPRSAFSKEEEEESSLGKWIANQKTRLTALVRRSNDYIAAHSDEAGGLSSQIEECQDRMKKVTAEYDSKRNKN